MRDMTDLQIIQFLLAVLIVQTLGIAYFAFRILEKMEQ